MFGGLADNEAEFDLEVDIDVSRDLDWGLVVGWWDDGGGGFEEEEGILGSCIVELGYVVTGIC